MEIIGVLLSLMGMVEMASGHPICPEGCKRSSHATWPHLLLSEQNQSIAPWKIEVAHTGGRLIPNARCGSCNVSGYKPIEINVTLYLPQPSRPSYETHCLCPFPVTVGCTCTKDPSDPVWQSGSARCR